MEIINKQDLRMIALQYAIEFCSKTNSAHRYYDSNDVLTMSDRFLNYMKKE